MTVEDYPITCRDLTARRMAQFNEFLLELENAMVLGEVLNAHFTKAKDALSRSLEAAWVETIRKPFAWNRDYILAAGHTERELLQDLDSPPQSNTLAKSERRAKAMPDTPTDRQLRALMAEVVPLVKDAKALAVKKTAAPRQRGATETYRAPAASGTSVAQVLAELEQITRDAREGIWDAIERRHGRMAEAFLAAQGALGNGCEEKPSKRLDIHGYVLAKSRQAGQSRDDPYLRRKLETIPATLSAAAAKFRLRIFAKTPAETASIRRISMPNDFDDELRPAEPRRSRPAQAV